MRNAASPTRTSAASQQLPGAKEPANNDGPVGLVGALATDGQFAHAMPGILDDHDSPLKQVGARIIQHLAQPRNHEVGARIVEAKQDNADGFAAAAGKNFTEIQVKG
ncbi:MAG TPA: hypothetical protein VHX65_06225 [Pirellulales bacterium]|jgi:hypothetical protein|nr:hypothetical protein [Pirellulales bacterium]